MSKVENLDYQIMLARVRAHKRGATPAEIQRNVAKLEQEPIYGLMVRYRPYRCDCCNHVHDIQTNHTGTCFSTCPKCSWHSAFDSKGNYYRADIGKDRPHYYIGKAPTAEEYNPHAGGHHAGK